VVTAPIPGSTLTNGDLIRGTNEYAKNAGSTLQTMNEIMDPTGAYSAATGYATGIRSGDETLFGLALGLIDFHHPWPKYLGDEIIRMAVP
jgi:hypothetical protein